MAAPFVTLRNPRTGNLIRAGSRLLRNHGGNLTAPVIVGQTRLDLSRLLEWPVTNNQYETFSRSRDWAQTLRGPLHRYSGVRIQPTWHLINAGAYTGWQPAMNRVKRIWRKGATGGLQRILVLTMEVNTNQIPVGDKCWFYHLAETGTFEGSMSKAADLEIYPGFRLRLRGTGDLYTITACRPSPVNSGYEGVISEVEITFPQDLPAIDFTPQQWNPHAWWPGHLESKLIFVHHSFYADASTKRLRYPLSWHFSILRDDVVKNGAAAIDGGIQRLPTWDCLTTMANKLDNHSLWFDLYRLEQEGKAEQLGDLDPALFATELENEAVEDWTDEAARSDTSLPDPAAAIGLRTSLLEYMIPIARAAWGPERTVIVKGTGFGGLDGVRQFDLNVASAFPGQRFLLGNHNYAGSFAPHISDGGRQLWYLSRADADEHARQLADKAAAMGFDGAIMTEWSSPNTTAATDRGKEIGMLHTALYAKGIPVCYWDLVPDLFGFADLYNDVPGSEGVTVQAVAPELRQYCGRANRTTA